MANKTPEQKQALHEMAQYGKRLQELAFENTGKYVVAGCAGNKTDTAKLYCYCGHDKGYKGAPIVPANSSAVVFTTKAAAEAKASLLHYQNGYGERIALRAMPASEYFWLLFDEVCKTMQLL